MLIENSDTRKSMKNTEIYLPDVECSRIIFVEDTNTSKKEIIVNRTASHSSLLSTQRNLPNILRNSNMKAHKNYDTLTSDKLDSYFLNTEHINSSFELNVTSSSVDSEKEVNYDKITPPKSHHQRKQVHNPLNLQYDMPDCNNNNKNKRLLPKVGQVDTLNVLSNQEENTLSNKLRCNNKTRKHLHNRKSKKIKTCKTNNETKVSNEKPDFDFGLMTIPDINMNDKVVVLQNVDYFLNNDTFIHSIYESNTSSYANRSYTNKNDIGVESEESFNISNYNNEIYNFQETCDMNYNPIVSGGSIEFNSMQHKTSQNRFTNNESSVIDVEEELIDGDVASNYLFKSKVLYTCTCMNCTPCDKDIIFYEDPLSTPTSSDNSEAELYTSHLCDFYSDYYYIFGDNWLKDSNNENLYCEEVEGMNVTKENAYVDCNNVAKVIESNASMNVLPKEQSELKDAQLCHIDKIQNTDFETCPMEFIAHSNGFKGSKKFIENVKGLDESNCLNLENAVKKKSKATLQNETRNAVSADVSVSKSKDEQQKQKQDLYVIQCAQCGKLFNQKHHFKKHFTRCTFYKEDFTCHICDKVYRYKSSLVQHLRKTHNISDGRHEKFYICNKCSKSYIRFRAFQRHLLLHD